MRSTRKQPFCWQEKKILRIIRRQFKKNELSKLRNLYLTITEMDSDFNGKDIKFYTKTIGSYSGLARDWIPTGLNILEDLQIIKIVEERENGKFKGKKLIFTPDNIKEIPRKTVTGKPVNGKSVPGLFDSSEDSSYLEDSNKKKDSIYIETATRILLYLNQKTGKNYKATYSQNGNGKGSGTLVNIIARLKEYKDITQGEKDCRRVIDIKFSHWKYDTEMRKYLTYITLFRPSKFPIYLEEEKWRWIETDQKIGRAVFVKKLGKLFKPVPESQVEE